MFTQNDDALNVEERVGSCKCIFGKSPTISIFSTNLSKPAYPKNQSRCID